jgi:cobalamin-dependent methionine synthase I
VSEAMHSAFYIMPFKNGMTMGIVNPEMLEIYDEIDPILLEHVEDVLLNRREDATERLLDLAESFKGDSFPNSMKKLLKNGETVQFKTINTFISKRN